MSDPTPNRPLPTLEDVFDLCEDFGFELSNPEESAEILLEMFRAVLARWGQGHAYAAEIRAIADWSEARWTEYLARSSAFPRTQRAMSAAVEAFLFDLRAEADRAEDHRG